MKKHIIVYLLLALMLVLVFAGCGKADAPAEPPGSDNSTGAPTEPQKPDDKIVAPEWPPNLEITFTSDDGSSISVPTVQTMTQWFYFDEEGNQKGVLADSPTPNEIRYDDNITLNLNGSGGEAEMLFSDENFIPDTIIVHRLDVIYLYGNQMNLHNDHSTAHDNANKNYEPVSLNGNRFRIDNDGVDYIYVISAKWDVKGLISSESGTTYCFRVNS